MQKTILTRLSVFFLILLIGAMAFANEEADVKATVTSAYVEGIHIEQNVEKIRAGFHSEFTMFVYRDDKIVKVSIDDWVSRIEASKAKKDSAPRPEVKHTFETVSVSGNAAVARVALYKDGKHVFTDFLSLYKFDAGWKIVAKTFYRH